MSSVEAVIPAINHNFRESPAVLGLQKAYGQKLGESVLKRIREQHKTGTGNELTPNRPEWQAFKQQNGYYPFPLMQSGQMTDVKNWRLKLNQEGGDFEADPDEWNKWIKVQEFRDESRPDANWNEAFAVGEADTKEADEIVDRSLDHILNDLFGGVQ